MRVPLLLRERAGCFSNVSGVLRSAQSLSARRYFLAGRNTHPAVVAVSLLSGLTSGITVLGMPGLVTAETARRRGP